MKGIDGIKLKNFQSFDKEGALIADPAQFNIFVGPNNVGKSKLTRTFERLRTGSTGQLLDKNSNNFDVSICSSVTAALVNQIASNPSILSALTTPISQRHMLKAIDSGYIEFSLKGSATVPRGQFIGFTEDPNNSVLNDEDVEIISEYFRRYTIRPPAEPLASQNYFYIAAERDVLPESTGFNAAKIEPSGKGTTALIRDFLLKASLDTDLVRRFMLEELNKILHPNYKFTEIRCQEIEVGNWEIFLNTQKYGDIALSQSGSGLKTIIQLLANTQLVLKSADEKITDGLYLFEELENSLHPRMQRNVYKYIEEKFEKDSICVMSTHSSVAIDYFQTKEVSRVYEVYQVENVTKCRKIEAFNDKLGVLDSLGIKASDALQSNFVLWVEGPTDRVYIKKMLSLVGFSDLVEGSDYSIMFYGGRLLSHLSLSEDETSTQFIRLLKINPRCAVLIDSDRTKKRGRLNDTKNRLRAEAEQNSKMCWVTQGREIENYFSPRFWRDHFNVQETDVSEYAKVYDHLYEREKRISGRKLNSKVELANFVDRTATFGDLHLNAERRIKELGKEIRLANS